MNPAVPENVGFCARALKTMGFASLRLIGSKIQDEKGARNTGYASHDILDSIENYATLAESIADCDLVIGTTAKSRVTRYDYLEPSELKPLIASKGGNLHLAIIFGTEENGLSNEELKLCDLLSTVPIATEYPSLNLAQAVLIYAYELSGVVVEKEENEFKPEKLQLALKEDASELLHKIGFEAKPIKKQRVMDRIMIANKKDSEMIMAVIGKFKIYMKEKLGG